MASFDAEQIANLLKRGENRLRIEQSGRIQVWFSTQIPNELPVGDKVQYESIENVQLPHNHFYITTNTIAGGMIYLTHSGPKSMSAGSFISISPLNSGKAIVSFELMESQNNSTKSDEALWVYGVESQENISFLCKGLTDGLLAPYIGHPLADVKIRILATLTHEIDSSAKAFEFLGKYLMDAMIFELYKQDWIKKS